MSVSQQLRDHIKAITGGLFLTFLKTLCAEAQGKDWACKGRIETEARSHGNTWSKNSHSESKERNRDRKGGKPSNVTDLRD